MAPRVSSARTSTAYAAAWREPDGTVARGSARLDGSHLVLRGFADGADVSRSIPLAEVTDVRIGRSGSARVQGMRSVVLRLTAGAELAVAPFGAGQVFELAELVEREADPRRDPASR